MKRTGWGSFRNDAEEYGRTLRVEYFPGLPEGMDKLKPHREEKSGDEEVRWAPSGERWPPQAVNSWAVGGKKKGAAVKHVEENGLEKKKSSKHLAGCRGLGLR